MDHGDAVNQKKRKKYNQNSLQKGTLPEQNEKYRYCTIKTENRAILFLMSFMYFTRNYELFYIFLT
jgi:hypothetical protein